MWSIRVCQFFQDIRVNETDENQFNTRNKDRINFKWEQNKWNLKRNIIFKFDIGI